MDRIGHFFTDLGMLKPGTSKAGWLRCLSPIRRLPDRDTPSRALDSGGSLSSLQHTAFLAGARRFMIFSEVLSDERWDWFLSRRRAS